ncbi:hypothetical protein CFK40_09930 [Virgibacillus necropolis]|uniref:Uncharacterized protein n=1 Tax=Virgibacillus necropolis TaxID=163877 RepID=A0A221MCA7_9BACI|nr:hypothetical protein CFK40_09930 [Virgibacillus necropolis]
MGHKKHQKLRSDRDLRTRKKMGNGWEARMLQELLDGEEPEEKEKSKKKKGNKESAKKLTNDSL